MRFLALVIAPLALAACNQTEPASPDAEGTTMPPAVANAPASAASTPAPAGTPEFAIPVALQGDWGMVPADCTSTRGDAKGLLRVSGTTLTFYESVGTLGTIKDRSETAIRADYAFTGEGMEWTRDVALTLSDDGKRLTRLDRGGEEPGGPFIYTKCQS